MPCPPLLWHCQHSLSGRVRQRSSNSSTAPAIMLRFSALLNHIIMKLLSCAVIFFWAPPSAAAPPAAAPPACLGGITKERRRWRRRPKERKERGSESVYSCRTNAVKQNDAKPMVKPEHWRQCPAPAALAGSRISSWPTRIAFM